MKMGYWIYHMLQMLVTI
ncbi:hypothetical protein ZEAMMB73_Zm00001d053764 [Zea mays]|uniref:Uncharacterized protein n=1 Tax=Zea mays TaxID=4577 RepID=A0A1D6QS40_MAIZE|nr:hypothetical protein ZEAMMB73_Zm00001d053764 [Zea mays]